MWLAVAREVCIAVGPGVATTACTPRRGMEGAIRLKAAEALVMTDGAGPQPCGGEPPGHPKHGSRRHSKLGKGRAGGAGRTGAG